MGYSRHCYVKFRRQPRHARVRLCGAVVCHDCGCALPVTHVVQRFGVQCRSCFASLYAGAVLMASHYTEEYHETPEVEL